jgi:hypothetical protein
MSINIKLRSAKEIEFNGGLYLVELFAFLELNKKLAVVESEIYNWNIYTIKEGYDFREKELIEIATISADWKRND